MKKRILSILLAIIMCLNLLPGTFASAAESVSYDNTGDNPDLMDINWAIDTLIVGDTYGIYPLSWYEDNIMNTIRKGQFYVIMAKMRLKLLDTDCVVTMPYQVYNLSNHITVREALTSLYSLLTDIEYSKEIGLLSDDPIQKLKEIGVYLVNDGEPALDEECSVVAACTYATRLITYMYNELDAASKGFLWSITSGDNTVYMLGSIHMASNKIYPFSQKILDAYAASDALVVEANILDYYGILKFSQTAIYTDGTTLKDHISEETYQKTIAATKKLGWTEQRTCLFKPWYLEILLINSPLDPASSQLGIDYSFLNNATMHEKPILEVEGMEYQAQLLDGFSDELDEYRLNISIDLFNSSNYEEAYQIVLDHMLDAWHEGDIGAIFNADSLSDEYIEEVDTIEINPTLDEEYDTKIFTQRDDGMADYIDQLLKAEGSATYFVVLGSAHYISDYSVLDRLEEKGYEITRIN